MLHRALCSAMCAKIRVQPSIIPETGRSPNTEQQGDVLGNIRSRASRNEMLEFSSPYRTEQQTSGEKVIARRCDRGVV